MEQQKRARKENRTTDQIKQKLEEAKAKHYMHIAKIEAQIKALDEPRKTRQKKTTVKSVIDDAKDEFTPEELKAILDEARRHKTEQAAG